MTQAFARVIADSISPEGKRITTFHLRYWRPIHAEARTHRVLSQSADQIVVHEAEISLMDDKSFSRNAGSSRARPSKSIIEQVRSAPWGPIHWGTNKPGMQAGEELDGQDLLRAHSNWAAAAAAAAHYAELLMKAGAHKQIVNRILEPYTYIDVLVTSTEYANWFALRDHEDAQPEIQEVARLMKAAMDASKPKLLYPGEWHLPYIEQPDRIEAKAHLQVMKPDYSLDELTSLLIKISVARCARVSYKPFDGTNSSIEADLDLYDKLLAGEPLHASPAEHQATPDVLISDQYCDGRWEEEAQHGNFVGWIQYRKTLPNEFVPN